MKTSIIQFLCFTLMAISTVTAAPPVVAPTPNAYITVYTIPSCGKASTPAGSITDDRSANLLPDTCVDITPPFTSFDAGLTTPCPSGQKPIVLAYPGKSCTGQPVSVTSFPASGAGGDCMEIIVDLSTIPPPITVGGQSANFFCR